MIADYFPGERGNCWIWTGGMSRGYGHVRSGNKMLAVHRTAFELQNGIEVPNGLDVCHHCDNPSCVRDTHLFAGRIFKICKMPFVKVEQGFTK